MPSLCHEYMNGAVRRAGDLGGVDHLLLRVEDLDNRAFEAFSEGATVEDLDAADVFDAAEIQQPVRIVLICRGVRHAVALKDLIEIAVDRQMRAAGVHDGRLDRRAGPVQFLAVARLMDLNFGQREGLFVSFDADPHELSSGKRLPGRRAGIRLFDLLQRFFRLLPQCIVLALERFAQRSDGFRRGQDLESLRGDPANVDVGVGVDRRQHDRLGGVILTVADDCGREVAGFRIVVLERTDQCGGALRCRAVA